MGDGWHDWGKVAAIKPSLSLEISQPASRYRDIGGSCHSNCVFFMRPCQLYGPPQGSSPDAATYHWMKMSYPSAFEWYKVMSSTFLTTVMIVLCASDLCEQVIQVCECPINSSVSKEICCCFIRLNVWINKPAVPRHISTLWNVHCSHSLILPGNLAYLKPQQPPQRRTFDTHNNIWEPRATTAASFVFHYECFSILNARRQKLQSGLWFPTLIHVCFSFIQRNVRFVSSNSRL